MTPSPEDIAKKIESLPPEVKAMLYSDEMFAAVTSVGQKNQLHVDQIDALNSETALTMMGFTETAQFPAALAKSLEIERAKAEAVAQDMNDTLFTKIRAGLKLPSSASEPSVVMPSAQKAAVAAPAVSIPVTSISSAQPSAPAPSPAPAPAPTHTDLQPAQTNPQPTKSSNPTASLPLVPDMHAAEVMLKEPTVSMAPKPAAPNTYKVDPYREPPE